MLKINRKSTINTNMLLFNAAGVLTGIIVVGYTVTSFFRTEVVPSCAGLYPTATQFGVETAGKPMTSIELQSRSGIREWGVLENAKVLKVDGAPAASVIEVKLARAKTSPMVEGQPLAGIGMNWVPQGLSGAESACLSYNVWIPADFDFGRMGSLPGVYGGVRPEPAAHLNDPKQGFNSKLVWGLGGEAHPTGSYLNAPDPRGGALGGGFPIPRGAWVRIDQEMVLNSGENADGAYRLWIDGKLTIANPAVQWRKDGKMHITGVVGDVLYQPGDQPKGSTSLRITPPILAWK